MEEILTRLLETMKLTPRRRFIKYLSIIVKINQRHQLKNNENIKKSIQQIIKNEGFNINNTLLINLKDNDLKLVYTLIKYKAITRDRKVSLENYNYLFSSNTFSKIFSQMNKNTLPLKNEEKSFLEQNSRKSITDTFLKGNEEQINVENYYIILIENFRLIKHFLEYEETNTTEKNLKFWLIKILDEIEKDLCNIMNAKTIPFDSIYTINFLIEIIFEIIKETKLRPNINLYKNLINSKKLNSHSETYKKLHIKTLIEFFVDFLNESINKFIFKGEEIESEYFFLKENILLTKNNKEIINEIQIVNEYLPFFLKEAEINQLLSISRKTRLIKTIKIDNTLSCDLKRLKIDNYIFSNESKIKTNKSLTEDLEKELNQFIDKHLTESLKDYLKFLKNIFLNSRSDFLTTLIKRISKIEKVSGEKTNFCKRSVTFLLTDSIKYCFKNQAKLTVDINDYEKDLDIIFVKVTPSNKINSETEEILFEETERLNIILKPQYPFNLFIDNQMRQILLKTLDFYMKLKRQELELSSLKTRYSRKRREGGLNIKKLAKIHKLLNLINNIYIFIYLKFKDWDIHFLNNFNAKCINKLISNENLLNCFKETKIKCLNQILKGIDLFCISDDESHLLFTINEIFNKKPVDLNFLKHVLSNLFK